MQPRQRFHSESGAVVERSSAFTFIGLDVKQAPPVWIINFLPDILDAEAAGASWGLPFRFEFPAVAPSETIAYAIPQACLDAADKIDAFIAAFVAEVEERAAERLHAENRRLRKNLLRRQAERAERLGRPLTDFDNWAASTLERADAKDPHGPIMRAWRQGKRLLRFAEACQKAAEELEE